MLAFAPPGITSSFIIRKLSPLFELKFIFLNYVLEFRVLIPLPESGERLVVPHEELGASWRTFSGILRAAAVR
jgi:hypothetical protein